MAYNNGFPVGYSYMQYPNYSGYQPINTMPPTNGATRGNGNIPAQPQNDSGIIWVQGETGAKSYPVAPNARLMLMDSESPTFYIKTADASGMPLPLKIFDYTERTPLEPQTAEPGTHYVTHEELEKRLAEITEPKKTTKKEGK